MTLFQLSALVFFLIAAAVSYRTEIVQWLQKLKPATAAPAEPNVAQQLVNDMVLVAGLRDRLGKIGCKDGVDACTLLLRVMVEYKYPQV